MQQLLLTLTIIPVFVTCRLTHSTDGEGNCEASTYSPVKCVECSTMSNSQRQYCADPFNSTMLQRNLNGLVLKECRGYCVKWVRKPPKELPGPTHYVRTCSTRLNIPYMKINAVCIHESRTGSGHLCFCKSKQRECNTATRNSRSPSLPPFVLVMSIVSLIFCQKLPIPSSLTHRA